MSTTQSAVTGVVYDNGSNVTQTPDNGESLWFLARFYLVAFIDVAGIMGNSLCVAVMTRKSLRSSQFALYTSVLAVSDTLIILQNVLHTYGRSMQLSPTMCGFILFLSYTSGTFSSWCIVQLTMDRFHAVIRPLEYYDQVHRKRAVIGLVISALLIMGFYSHCLIHAAYYSDPVSCWWAETFRKSQFYRIFLWLSTLVFSVMPFVIIITLNGAIIWHLKCKRSTVRNNSSELQRNGTIITLLAVSFCFVIFTSPVCVCDIYGYITGKNLAESNPFDNISFVLFELNYTCNFYIYCLTGSKVRNELRKILHCFCCHLRGAKAEVLTSQPNHPAKDTNGLTKL